PTVPALLPYTTLFRSPQPLVHRVVATTHEPGAPFPSRGGGGSPLPSGFQVFDDLGDGSLRGTAGADDGVRGETGPVPMAEQVQSGLVDRPVSFHRDTAVLVDHPQGFQVPQGGSESGAPQHSIAVPGGSVVPGHTGGGESV